MRGRWACGRDCADRGQSFRVSEKASEVIAQFKGKTIGTPRKGSIHDVILHNVIKISDLLIQSRSRTSIGPTSFWLP